MTGDVVSSIIITKNYNSPYGVQPTSENSKDDYWTAIQYRPTISVFPLRKITLSCKKKLPHSWRNPCVQSLPYRKQRLQRTMAVRNVFGVHHAPAHRAEAPGVINIFRTLYTHPHSVWSRPNISWHRGPAGVGEGHVFFGMTDRLPHPQGGSSEIVQPWPKDAPSEFSSAFVL